VDDDATARHHAREIIEQIKRTGTPPEPKSWDNALVISQTLLEWLRDEGYNEENSPYVGIVEQLWFKYAQASLAAEQQRQFEAQGMKAAGVMPNMALANPMGQGPNGPKDTSPQSVPGAERETQATDRTTQGMARGSAPQEGATVQ
jgi:hypothetical protein